MNWLAKQIQWIMVVSGALTCTMFYAAVAPEAALQSNFGESLDGAAAQIVVRNWGALVGLVGLMLIYGAFNHSPTRREWPSVSTHYGSWCSPGTCSAHGNSARAEVCGEAKQCL
jgi:hypothetical protein